MDELVEGSVVICSTGQAGSLIQIDGKNVWVLLRNNDIFTGTSHQIRIPQGQEDLDAAPIDISRIEVKRSTRPDRD